jgi:hypothetical protein
MTRLSYKYLVSQIENGVFHVAHQMPMNPETAQAVYQKYCQLCNIAAPKIPSHTLDFTSRPTFGLSTRMGAHEDCNS